MSGLLGQDGSSLIGGIDSSTGLPRAATIDHATGNLLTSSTGGGGSSDVAIHDNATPTQHLAVDASGKIGINALPSLPTGSNLIGTVEVADSGGSNKLAVDASGKIGINNLPAEQSVNINQVNGSALSNTNPVPSNSVVSTTGGATPYHNITAATTNFTNTKAVATALYGYAISNTSASVIYVKFYNKASAPVNTDTPKHTIMVPANGVVVRAFPDGVAYGTGFGWGATAGVGDNDNTAIAANCVVDFELAN